ncbi:MAG TPA: plasmid pRiA4b ORF-3 family protein [Gemmataceae bacterium]|jgi:hypothetical protein
MARKSRPPAADAAIPDKVRPTYDAVVAKTDAFCRDHLTAEYTDLCRKLAGVLARKRPSPLTRGKPESWAAGVVRAVGWANFLGDPSQTPHMATADIDRAFGISEATGHAKSKAIRDLLDIRRFDPDWTLPSQMAKNPLAWLISVNGIPVDARLLPREVQEQAVRKGLIPPIPREDEDEARPGPATDRTYQLKVTLADIRPPVWRRIRVPDCTLDELHDSIQTAMGWENAHLHHFKVGGQYYGDPELMGENFAEFGYKDSTMTRLSDIVPAGGKKLRFEYEYDFGDSWWHEIRGEKVEEGRAEPECVAGARACPPEDCGGPWGYADFCDAVADPNHERHEELTEWIGGPFDPEAFDPEAATRRMRRGLPNWRTAR